MTAMPFSFPIFRAFTTTGTMGPLAGGLLHTFEAGTSTPLAVYQDAALTVPHTNPVVLDSNGQATIYLGPNAYKMRLEDSTGAVQPGWPIDGIQKDTDILRSVLAASSGSSLVGFLQSGTGAVARTVQAKGWETVSVKDFGAVGDGVANDYAAITAASNAVSPNGRVIFPLPGTYKFDSQITLPSGVEWEGQGSERLGGLLSNVIGAPSINVGNGYYSKISNLNISHTTPASANTAVQIIDNGAGDPVAYFRMRDCRITNHVTGVRINGEATWACFDDILCTGLTGVGFSVTGANLTQFNRCMVDTSLTAWFLQDVSKAILTGCTAQQCYSHTNAAVDILDSDNVEIKSLWTERNEYHNILIHGASTNTCIYESLIQGAGTTFGTGRGLYISGTATQTHVYGCKFGGNATNDITTDATSNTAVFIEPVSTTGSLAFNDSSATSLWVSKNMRGVSGISSNASPAKNLAGYVTIADANTFADVAFPVAENDGNFRVFLSAGTQTGAPATAAKRAAWGNKSTAGFRILLEAAPGAGTSVRVDWLIIRST